MGSSSQNNVSSVPKTLLTDVASFVLPVVRGQACFGFQSGMPARFYDLSRSQLHSNFGFPFSSRATKVKMPLVTFNFSPIRSLKAHASNEMLIEVFPVFLTNE